MQKKRKILIFGATGSIGSLGLEVMAKQNYELVGFSYNQNFEQAKKIKQKYPNSLVFSPSISSFNNVGSFNELLKKSNPDIVLNALVGFAGLEVTLLTIDNQINLALANKESLVVAGWLIKSLLSKSKTKLYPVDSEHSSLTEILKNSNKKVDELIITCSGGPFFNKKINELKDIKFSDAIKHPTWNMGYKISIDSATMMNKCFEIIEAFYLFNTKKIKVYQHPQSIVHALVRFTDNSYFAYLSKPDMKLAIQQALNEYCSTTKIINNLSFNKLDLSFNKINSNMWKPIKWAYDFLSNKNITIPIIMNAANEEAIDLFKNNQIKYLDIIEIIEKAIITFKTEKIKKLNEIINLNNKVKKFVKSLYLNK